EVDLLVQRPALQGDPAGIGFMPEPAAAIRAEGTAQLAAAVGVAGPVFRLALGDFEPLGRHLDPDAEGGGRLVSAFAAMAARDRPRCSTMPVAHGTALAATGHHPPLRPITMISRASGVKGARFQ